MFRQPGPFTRLHRGPGPRYNRRLPGGIRLQPEPVMTTLNSFDTRTELQVGDQTVQIYSLPSLERAGFAGVSRLPYSMKILLENLLRREDNAFVKADDIRAVAAWNATAAV